MSHSPLRTAWSCLALLALPGLVGCVVEADEADDADKRPPRPPRGGVDARLADPPDAMPPPTDPPTEANLIFQSRFENADFLTNPWNGVETGNAHGIERSALQKRGGSYAGRFIVTTSDALAAGSFRSELTNWPPDPNIRAEQWYGMSLFLPADYIADPCEEILFQWHAHNAGNPPMFMLTRNGRWVWAQMGQPAIDLGAYRTGVWTDYVLHIKFSPTSDGLVEIWRDGVRVLARTAVNVPAADTMGPYFKLGIYKYGWKDGYPTNTSSRTLFFDEVRIGNARASYAEVAPR